MSQAQPHEDIRAWPHGAAPRRARHLPREALAPVSDAELAARATAGDEGAFEELYHRHVAAAWRVAQAVTGNRHDAADAVSESFTRVLQSVVAGRLRAGTQFRAYLLTACRNSSIDLLRRAQRVHPTGLQERLDDPDGVLQPADSMVDAEEHEIVARAFRTLPERWRSVLWLTEVEGVPVKQAASILGLSPNGLAQLAVRARAGLRDRFLQAHAACGCCARRRAGMDDLGSVLRRISLPLPPALVEAAANELRSTERRLGRPRHDQAATDGCSGAASGRVC